MEFGVYSFDLLLELCEIGEISELMISNDNFVGLIFKESPLDVAIPFGDDIPDLELVGVSLSLEDCKFISNDLLWVELCNLVGKLGLVEGLYDLGDEVDYGLFFTLLAVVDGVGDVLDEDCDGWVRMHLVLLCKILIARRVHLGKADVETNELAIFGYFFELRSEFFTKFAG